MEGVEILEGVPFPEMPRSSANVLINLKNNSA